MILSLILSLGFYTLGWYLIKSEKPPRWLAWLAILAVLLRFGIGVLWTYTMPAWGHNTPAERAGYAMADAYERDQAAWKLANSDKPLWTAFFNNRMSDQYGGLLFLSAMLYRYGGEDTHQPWMVVVITATFSALAVFFTWGLAKRAWGEKEAQLAAWIVTVFPEAVLLGSSQMREAFTVTFSSAAFYGLARTLKEKSFKDLAWILLPVLLSLPFSPPFAALLLGMLGLSFIILRSNLAIRPEHRKRTLLIIGGLVILILTGIWLALRQFTPPGMIDPLEMLSWWVRKSAGLQAYLSQHASGWIQKVFRASPEWLHLPILLGYGVVQPFLPAAIIVGSHAPIWPWVALWRSIGWTITLVFLVYAPMAAWGRRGNRQFAQALSMVVWLGILVASFRGGGDMWDNPRYRAAFTGLLAALAAWAWWEQRHAKDAWFRRVMVGMAAVLTWFLPWYLRRYTAFTWPVVDLFKTLGLGVATVFLYVLADWARTKQDSKLK